MSDICDKDSLSKVPFAHKALQMETSNEFEITSVHKYNFTNIKKIE